MAPLIRTNQGRLEAFNSHSSLPDDLRMLLKFIDGKRNEVDLQRVLKPHICAPEKIQCLIDLGLVTSILDSIMEQTKKDSVIEAYSETMPAQLPAFGAFSQPFTVTNSQHMLPPEKTASALNDAKTLMENFLLQEAPSLAMTMLGDIEEITTMSQLQASLGAYELMIKNNTPNAAAHLAELRQMLEATTV